MKLKLAHGVGRQIAQREYLAVYSDSMEIAVNHPGWVPDENGTRHIVFGESGARRRHVIVITDPTPFKLGFRRINGVGSID